MSVIDSGREEGLPTKNNGNGGKIDFGQKNTSKTKDSSAFTGSDFSVVPLPLDKNQRGFKPKPKITLDDSDRKKVSFGSGPDFNSF